jgi:hypothetical protein
MRLDVHKRIRNTQIRPTQHRPNDPSDPMPLVHRRSSIDLDVDLDEQNSSTLANTAFFDCKHPADPCC